MAKRILRPIVKMVAGLAGVVFLFDNHPSGTAGLILLASIAMLFLCGFVWMVFLREDEDGGAGGAIRGRPVVGHGEGRLSLGAVRNRRNGDRCRCDTSGMKPQYPPGGLRGQS